MISRVQHTLGYGPAPAKASNALRIGVLGAANIAPPALIWPATFVAGAAIVAVAARDKARAEEFAKKHKIPKAYGSYEELIADPEIDAIYIPSPNGLHFPWAVKSLQAGKHVLCEKPLTANEEEAKQLVEVAKQSKRVLMEASHSFHHPVSIRAREIVRSGEIGEVLEVETALELPFVRSEDIRFDVNGTQRKLAGGAFMDTGVYACNAARFYADLTFARCVSAKGVERFTGVDETMEAMVEFENSSVKGKITSSLNRRFPWLPRCFATITGTKGKVTVFNYALPFLYHYIEITPNGGKSRTEKVYEDGKSTYEHQLLVFIECVQKQTEGGLAKTRTGGTIDDPVNTMKMIDAVYEKSGLKKREGYGL